MSWINIEGTLYGKQGESPAEVVDLNELYAELDELSAAISEIKEQKKPTADKDADTMEAIDFWNKQKIDYILDPFEVEFAKINEKINEILNGSSN